MEDLNINGKVEKIINEIANFIETSMEERRASGLLILFSGFIDSTVIAKICIEAVGKEKVKLLIRSDKFIDNQDDIIAHSIKYLEINEEQIVRCEIEPMLRNFGSENLIPGSVREIPSLYHPLSHSILKSTLNTELEGTFGMVGEASTGREKVLHKIIAYNKLRSRLQMAVAYFTAETENRILIGTINKTELLTGLFTIWGHSHCSDLMPLGNLYRSQILQIAEVLSVPIDIRSAAKADLLPGIENKYMQFFNLSAYDVDQVLVRLEQGLSPEEIMKETSYSSESVEKINLYFNSSVYSRAAPLIPKI